MFIDTCFYVDLMREHSKGIVGPAKKKCVELGNLTIRLPLFVLCELYAGASMSDNPTLELRKIEMFSENVETVYPNQSFAFMYGETEALIRKNGFTVSSMDLLIGVLAKSHGQPLLTKNLKDFEKIPGLVVEKY